MQKSTKVFALFWALLPAFFLSCQREVESPYLSNSTEYAGDAWTEDKNKDGIADSVQKYSPGCDLSPGKCLEKAKILSRLQNSSLLLSAADMVLWINDGAVLPRLNWIPAEAASLGYKLSSSDTNKVLIKDGSLIPREAGSVQIVVSALGNNFLSASFIAKVYAEGKKVESITTRDMTLKIGQDTLPDLIWTPADATLKEFSLKSNKPEVAEIVGQKIMALTPGSATLIAETWDGAKKAVFTVTVIPGAQKIMTDSILVSDMFLISGGDPQSPIFQWYPINASDQRFNLLSMDSTKAALNDRKNQIVPKASGIADVYAFALDGSGKNYHFKVKVSAVSVAVKGVSAENMNLNLGSEAQAPTLRWLPTDATNQQITLTSNHPEIAIPQGGKIRPVSMGVASFELTTVEGGFKSTFTVTVGQSDTAIHVDSVQVQNLSLIEGIEGKPTLTWFPTNAGNKAYTLISSDPRIATANGDRIYPVKAGAVQCTLTTVDGLKKYPFQVSVTALTVLANRIQVDSISMVLGDADKTPNLKWEPANVTNQGYTLTTTDTPYVTIIGGTKIHAKGVGQAKIEVRAKEGPATTSFMVLVNAQAIPVQSVSVHRLDLNLGDAAKDPPGIFWNPSNATNTNYSLNTPIRTPAIIAIEGNKIKAVSVGEALVTLISSENSNITAICSVKVRALVRSITSRNDTLRLGAAEKDPARLFTWDPVTASNKSYSLRSLDTAKVRISTDGLRLRPVGGGNANIIVTAQDGSQKSDTFNVLVQIPVKGILARDTTLPVSSQPVDPSRLFTWSPSNASNKNWSLVFPTSPAPLHIVKIINSWQLEAVGPGTADVTVISSDSNAVKATFKVTVTVPSAGLSAADIKIKVGEMGSPNLTWIPASTTDKGFILSGGNPTIAKISGNTIQGMGIGTTDILVTSTADPTKKATFKVTVYQPVISVMAKNLVMRLNESYRDPDLVWNPTDASDKTFSLTSSNSSIVSVNGGKLNAVGSGLANITLITTDGAKTAYFSVTVTVPVISISAENLELEIGQQKVPLLTWNPWNASDKGFTLTSQDSNIVSIVSGTQVLGVKGGFTNILATSSDGGKIASFRVDVVVPVIGVEVNNMNLNKGGLAEAPVITWNPINATNKGYSLSVLTGSNFISIQGNQIKGENKGLAQVQLTPLGGGLPVKFMVTVH